MPHDAKALQRATVAPRATLCYHTRTHSNMIDRDRARSRQYDHPPEPAHLSSPPSRFRHPQRAPRSPFPPSLYGKFCGHLRDSIYHGMDAPLTLNPTLEAWSFGGRRDALNPPDGDGLSARPGRCLQP